MRTILLAIAATLYLAAPTQAKPTVLIYPPGGWTTALPSNVYEHANQFRAAGFRAKIVAYQTGSVEAGQRSVDAAAARWRRSGPVIAVGVSAGGTLAASQGARGLVSLAVNVIGPTDLTTWSGPAADAFLPLLGMSPQRARRVSPLFQLSRARRPSPQLIQCGWVDTWVSWAQQCSRYVLRARQVGGEATFMGMPSAHVHTPDQIARTVAFVRGRHRP